MRVVVTGSHGLIGSAVVARLEARGDEVTRLVRRPPGPGEARWDPAAGLIDGAALEGHDAVVHLAGEGIAARRWTSAHKARVRESRVKGTGLLAEAVAGLQSRPEVLVSGSAIGYYGDRGDDMITEADPPGTDFLARLCVDWEGATAPAQAAGVRVTQVRSGIVLSRRGGALGRQLPLFRLGLGGRLGSGRQYVSWISRDDEVGAILHAIETRAVTGPVNATAPNPVTNADFTKALARALRRPAVLPVPRAALGLVLGRELVDSLLASQRVLPTRLEATGYRFAHPELPEAFASILG